MNREERRKAARTKDSAPKPKPMSTRPRELTPMEKLNRICSQGITPKDLKDEFEKGYKAGATDTVKFWHPFSRGALAVALRETYGFGAKRIQSVIDCFEDVMMQEVSVEDMLDRVKRETGIEMER